MSDNQNIFKQNIDSHLFEINRLSTIKSNNVDFNKLIKEAKNKHSQAYKSYKLPFSEHNLVTASKKSILAWNYSSYINEYSNNPESF